MNSWNRSLLTVAAASILISGCGVGEAQAEARRTHTWMGMSAAKTAVMMYMVETGKLPATLEDLRKPLKGATREYPTGLIEGELTDDWGRPFIYEPTDARKFVIRSLGADGKPGGTGEDADLDANIRPF